jgi:hypothetical protein
MLITIPNNIFKSQIFNITVNTDDLVLISKIASSGLFKDRDSWRSVSLEYINPINNQKQIKNLSYSSTQLDIPFNISSRFVQNSLLLNSLTIYDRGNGNIVLRRSDIPNVANYDFVIGNFGLTAIGGNFITTVGDYRYHYFYSNGNFEITELGLENAIDYLVVAGGGSGARNASSQGGAGGGGAGGAIQKTNQSLTVGQYSVTIGDGGAVPAVNTNGINGANSIFNSDTAIGGGGGGGNNAASNGGSGGGAGWYQSTFGLGTVGQGNNGGAGLIDQAGGGGGASEVGQSAVGTVPGRGGNGLLWLDGNYYAGGGAGGGYIPVDGGLGGGGKGSDNSVNASLPSNMDGVGNTGGGGGGGYSNSNSGAGGSGIVVIRYRVRD